MTSNCRRRTTCRLCHGKNVELVMKLAPTPTADAYVPAARLKETQEYFPLDLFFCLDCSHVQLLDVVDPEILYGNYIYVTLTSLGLDSHFDQYAENVLKRIRPAPGSLVVEFGSNDGTLLRGFQKRGMKVLGIDPARDIAQQATAAGVETWPAYFTLDLAQKIKQERGAASVIAANNVIANIDVLDDVMRGIRTLLAPSGVFVFETGYLLDLVQNGVFDNIYHEHISYHSVKPFDIFFRKEGMELFHVDLVDTKGGSIRGMVQLAGGPHKVSPAVQELIGLEQKHALDSAQTYKDFSEMLARVKKDLRKLLQEQKTMGKRIAGYGASHSVTTLVHHFDIAEFLEFIVDDNPRKQNTFSPGHHIPVLAPQALYEKKPDLVVILPWRFAEPIMKKHTAFKAQGGHFIVPLPNVDIL